MVKWLLRKLYIVLFLHQTTTLPHRWICDFRCISYYSYIKPQPSLSLWTAPRVVYRTIPTSNHNCVTNLLTYLLVVYRTIPTSNHNCFYYHNNRMWVVYRTIPTSNHNPTFFFSISGPLYIVLFLHQTTTNCKCGATQKELYIVLFLHQTTTAHVVEHQLGVLYIVLFLHQTTTWTTFGTSPSSCISYYSYIKPQLYVHL